VRDGKEGEWIEGEGRTYAGRYRHYLFYKGIFSAKISLAPEYTVLSLYDKKKRISN
jgi:hypothetical protein